MTMRAVSSGEGSTVTGSPSPSAAVLRFPPRLRVVSPNLGRPPAALKTEGSALGALLLAGAIDARQHAAGAAYARLRRKLERSGGCPLSWKDRPDGWL